MSASRGWLELASLGPLHSSRKYGFPTSPVHFPSHAYCPSIPPPAAPSQSSHQIIIALDLSHILHQSVTNDVGLIGECSPKLLTLPLAKSFIDQATVHALMDDGVRTVRQEAGFFAFIGTVPASTWRTLAAVRMVRLKITIQIVRVRNFAVMFAVIDLFEISEFFIYLIRLDQIQMERTFYGSKVKRVCFLGDEASSNNRNQGTLT